MISLEVGDMSVNHRDMTWTLMPLFLAGVLCNTWTVEYQQQHICAVDGSSVVIPCLFYHPNNLAVSSVLWGHVKSRRPSRGRVVSGSNLRTTRFQYVGDKQHNCSFKIHQVEHNDAGIYTVRFFRNNKKGISPGKVSPTLKVVDPKVWATKPDGAMTEGDSVNLTCLNACYGTYSLSAFSWFKNGEPINEGAVLYLSNMSSTDSGNYTCSLKTHAETTSGVISIDVEYGPKNTTVSVRPSTEVDAGSNITLICSSHANPPVENYTWFKIDDDAILAVGHQPVFLSADGGQYLCSVTNKHGNQNSSVVILKIKPYWATFTRDVLIISTVAVLLIGTTVIAVRRLKRKRKWAPNADCGEDIQITEYINWLHCDSNQPQGGHQREAEATELIYATVNKIREPNTEQQMDSRHEECVIYSVVCRRQPLNPSYSEPP